MLFYLTNKCKSGKNAKYSDRAPAGVTGNQTLHFTSIALIHDSRHVGFQIVMQISHVLCWGADIGINANCGKSAGRNIELTLLKVHFRI